MWWPCLVLSLQLAQPVINELLYDPPGPDGGREFVEIFNPGPGDADLSGASLRFVNGSEPSASTLIWSGEPGLVLGPREWFVVGGAGVDGRDRTVEPGLQNGAEAVELWIDGARADAVAWGGPVTGSGEGIPAEPAPGQALGRVPDGHDTGDNRGDLRALPVPTPGEENLAAQDFRLARWWTRPVWREDGGPIDLEVEIVASGWAERQTGTLEFGGRRFVLAAGPADTLRCSTTLACAPGDRTVDLLLTAGAPEPGRIGRLPLRCGVDRLVFTEVQPRPDDGEPEWVELFNRSGQVVPLAGWALRDRGGRARAVADSGSVAPGERIVLAADAVALRAVYPALRARVVEPRGGWPSLNDSSPDATSAADSLHLLRPDGAVVDLVTWRREDLDERGRSLQRGRVRAGEPSIWLPATGEPGPGETAPDERRTWPPTGLECAPDPFTPDADGSGDELEVLVAGDVGEATARIYDLQGDLVTELVLRGSAVRRAARWDGRDDEGRPVPDGAYVVVVAGSGPGGSAVRLRRVVGLGRIR